MEIIKAASESDFIRNAVRDFKSTRSLWCWVYLALYVWISIWALRHRPEAARTVVSVTGGLASCIFTGYVFSRTFEKRHKLGAFAPPGSDDARGPQP